MAQCQSKDMLNAFSPSPITRAQSQTAAEGALLGGEREYQELIQETKVLSGAENGRVSGGRLGRLRNHFQEIVEVDFFDSPLQVRVRELLEQASASRTAKPIQSTLD